MDEYVGQDQTYGIASSQINPFVSVFVGILVLVFVFPYLNEDVGQGQVGPNLADGIFPNKSPSVHCSPQTICTP